MSFSALNSPAASILLDFNNDQGSPSPSPFPSSSPSMLSDVDHPSSDLITLDSFIPILKHLPGLYLDQNSYYMIRGSLTTADWEGLRDYARTVSNFILTDKDSKGQISPAAFLRLARLQHPDMPLLPSLSDLVIADADASIAHLDLLLTPSLKSLKASCIPDAQQSTFFSFLTAVEQEAPLLQTLILGPGRFLSSSLQTIPQFNNLRHLELEHEDSELPFAFFDNIGSLPKLETLILDARHVSSTMMGDEPTVPPAFNNPNHFPSDNSNAATDSNHNGYASAANTTHSKTCHTPISPSCNFNQLAKLHVIGWLSLLEDLIPRIMSTRLEDVSVTFIRLSYDELTASLAKEKAERERKAEENRRREEAEKKKKEQEKLWKDEMELEERLWREEQEKKKKDEEQLLRDIAEQNSMNHSLFGFTSSPPPHPPFSPLSDHTYDSPRPVSMSSLHPPFATPGLCSPPVFSPQIPAYDHSPFDIPPPIPSDEPQVPTHYLNGGKKMKKTQAREARERLLKEQKRLASLSFDAHTVSFAELLRKLCSRWTASLKTLTVCQIGGSFQSLLQPPTLPEETFRTMLLLPAIESLELKGCILDSVEGVLNGEESMSPNLNTLLLPLSSGETNSGISLPTLRRVAKTCPKLESFQCHIDSLSSVPEYPVPTNVGLSHGLRRLSVGNSFPIPDTKRLYLIARHLYLLFPNLETINTSEEHNAEQWVIVGKFVKMFQTARMDDLNRQ